MSPPMVRNVFRTSLLYLSRPRFLSSQHSPATTRKEVSPHIGFYRNFGRPIAKVLLIATFTYQLSYWLWVKLETDEIRAEKQAEISMLENKLEQLTKANK